MIKRVLLLLVLVTLTGAGFAQNTMFKLQNPKNLKYDETEAMTAYAIGMAAVQHEYHLLEPQHPEFTLVLGSEPEQIDLPDPDINKPGEVHMKTWNKFSFRWAVIALCINDLRQKKNISRIELEIERQEDAVVDIKQLRK